MSKQVKVLSRAQRLCPNGHDWGTGTHAGVCLRCGHGTCDGLIAREKNAKLAREEVERRTGNGRV